MDDKVKDLLEKIRGAADVAADACADTARVAGRKAGQMVDVAKLNVQLFDLNGEFNDILRQLGQVMYNTHLGREAEGDPVSGLLARADETAAKVAEAARKKYGQVLCWPCVTKRKEAADHGPEVHAD